VDLSKFGEETKAREESGLRTGGQNLKNDLHRGGNWEVSTVLLTLYTHKLK